MQRPAPASGRSARFGIFPQVLGLVIALLVGCRVAVGAQNLQQPSSGSALIQTVYQLLQTTFYLPINGKALRAGADASILAFARKHGIRNPRITANHPGEGTPALILADAIEATKAYRLKPQEAVYAAAGPTPARARHRISEIIARKVSHAKTAATHGARPGKVRALDRAA